MKPKRRSHDPDRRDAVATGAARGIVEVAVYAVSVYLGCTEPAARRMLEASLAQLERRGL